MSISVCTRIIHATPDGIAVHLECVDIGNEPGPLFVNYQNIGPCTLEPRHPRLTKQPGRATADFRIVGTYPGRVIITATGHNAVTSTASIELPPLSV